MRSACAVLLLCPATLLGQEFSQRGFFDFRVTGYPQTVPQDSAHTVGEARLRYEASGALSHGFQVFGSFEARTDTHWQTEREVRADFGDRGILRPALSVRQLSVSYHKGAFTLEVGKQFVRWGKADILNPTDRFAPRDFLNVIDPEYLPVTAVRLTLDHRSDRAEVVWQPFFTPSRMPLQNQRWGANLSALNGMDVFDNGQRIPGGSAVGARWNHVGKYLEASLSYYRGHNYLPSFAWALETPSRMNFTRSYPQLQLYGADAAIPTRWFTVKAESAYFQSSTKDQDEYVLYVVELERQTGEWNFVGGYAGEVVTNERSLLSFAPDRGFARAFLGRASYTIDSNRSLAFESAVRQNGDGVSIRVEYSQAFGRHWRAIIAIIGIRGDPLDFLGQYRRNSNGRLSLRYSF